MPCDVRGCSVSESALQRCARCRAALYCSRDHQTQDFPHHKTFCKRIAKHLKLIEDAKEKLREEEDGMFCPHDVFENGVGDFWGIFPTRPYMRAKGQLIQALELQGSVNSLTCAYDEIRDCLRLCNRDNMGLRDQVPGILMRLNRDQECYDFIKYWVNDYMGEYEHPPAGHEQEYADSDDDNGDENEEEEEDDHEENEGARRRRPRWEKPFLHLTNEDIAEPLLEGFTSQYGCGLQFCVGALLLKFRLCERLKALLKTVDSLEAGAKAKATAKAEAEATKTKADNMNTTMAEWTTATASMPVAHWLVGMDDGHQGIVAKVLEFLPSDQRRVLQKTRSELSQLVDDLQQQVQTLLTHCDRFNKYALKAMLNPQPVMQLHVEYYSAGDPNEAQLVVKSLFPVFHQTPGAIQLIKDFYHGDVSYTIPSTV